MFTSFRKSNNTANEQEDTSNTEDFVNIMEEEINSAQSVASTIHETSAIRVKITPKHDTIGLDDR